MLSRTHRFHGYNSLDPVYRRGHTVRGPLTRLRVYDNPKRQSYRVAVVVSKKVYKSAVARNRVRRRIFEIVRHNAQLISGPYDLVFTVFNDRTAELPASELGRAIVKQLKALPAKPPTH